MAIDYGQLYIFSHDFSLRGGSMIVSPTSDVVEDDYALLRGDVRPRKAIRFDRQAGRRVCDVIWAGHPLVLISRRFRDVLKSERFTGWATYPVAVYDGEGKQVRNYFGLSITGRVGPLDESRCQQEWRDPVVEGGPEYEVNVGLFFKDDDWDGSDVVLPANAAYKIVTARVKDALGSLKIPNVEFERLTQHESSTGRLRKAQ